MTRIFLSLLAICLFSPGVLSAHAQNTPEDKAMPKVPADSYIATSEMVGKCGRKNEIPAKCEKLPMQPDGITRLSKIEVHPEYLDEYLQYATEVGAESLRTEPGVLAMYAMSEKDNPTIITILEIYSSQAAYKSHIASRHFQKYKRGTLKMVKNLILSDQRPLNPDNRIHNYMMPGRNE